MRGSIAASRREHENSGSRAVVFSKTCSLESRSNLASVRVSRAFAACESQSGTS
jgi:hypothetical protein